MLRAIKGRAGIWLVITVGLSLLLSACAESGGLNSTSQAVIPFAGATTPAPASSTASLTTAAPITTVAAQTSAPPLFDGSGVTTAAAPTAAALTTVPADTSTLAPTPTVPVGTVVAPLTVAPAQLNPSVFYLRDDALYRVQPTGNKPVLVAQKVLNFVQVGGTDVVYMQQVTSGAEIVVQLRLLKEAGVNVATPKVLDERAFVLLPVAQRTKGPVEEYGSDRRAVGELALSPDNSQVAYTRANLSGPTFGGLGSEKEHPTELWFAVLDGSAPARKLVPNDKDYIARPLWSSDGNRIAFIRTTNFGTGAGYPTAIWSVYKDGTRLAYLTGPKLGQYNGSTFEASPAINLKWVGPMALSFQSFSQTTAAPPLWLHDLSQNSDLPRLLTLESGQTYFCPQLRRFVFVKQDLKTGEANGVFSVGIDKPGDAAPSVLTAVDGGAKALLGCSDNTILYRDGSGQTYAQRLNESGSAEGAKVKVAGAVKPSVSLQGVFSPDGKYIAVAHGYLSDSGANPGPLLAVYRADGSLVASLDDLSNGGTLKWFGNGVVVLLASTNNSDQLVGVSLNGGAPVIKVLDSGKGLLKLGPDR